MTYQLICDSCTDLPAETLRDPHVVKVPLSIQVGPETVIDDENFRQLELLQKMRAWPDAPKTACPSPSAYMEQFREGKDNYIVTLSARLSGSYNAAMQARAIYREEGGHAAPPCRGRPKSRCWSGNWPGAGWPLLRWWNG